MTAENTLKQLHVPSPTTKEYGDFKVTKEYVTMYEFERGIKAADMVSVVRCRDCKHYDPDGEPSDVYPDRHWCGKMWHYMQPDGFCAWGERR